MKEGNILVVKNDGSVPSRFRNLLAGTLWKMKEDRGGGRITVMDKNFAGIRTNSRYFDVVDERTFDQLTVNGGETDMFFRLIAIEDVGPDTEFPTPPGFTTIQVNGDSVDVATGLVGSLSAHKPEKLVQRKLAGANHSSASCCG